jgi:hypothetical protein
MQAFMAPIGIGMLLLLLVDGVDYLLVHSLLKRRGTTSSLFDHCPGICVY